MVIFPIITLTLLIQKILEFCQTEIKKNNYDLGIAFDGDGDRIGVVDDKARIVPGDMLLLILAKDMISKKTRIHLLLVM